MNLRELSENKSLLLTNIVVLSEVLVLGRNATGERVTSQPDTSKLEHTTEHEKFPVLAKAPDNY